MAFWPLFQIIFSMKDIKQAQNKNSIYSQLRTYFKEITINTPNNEK